MRRWGLSLDIVDDLVQETYLKLCVDGCEHLKQFSIANPQAIEAYIKTIAINVAQDYIRSWRAQRRGRGQISQLPEHLEPKAEGGALGGEQAIEQSILIGEIDRHLDACVQGEGRNRDRIIFWLHYQHGMTAKAISALPAINLSVKGVESALLRMTRHVRQRIGHLQGHGKGESAAPSEGFSRPTSY